MGALTLLPPPRDPYRRIEDMADAEPWRRNDTGQVQTHGQWITPGVIDPAAFELYRHCACVLLAFDLHTRTGWPMVAVVNEFGTFIHAAVRHPSGGVFDIGGRGTDAEITAYYEREVPSTVRSATVRDLTLDEFGELVNAKPMTRAALLGWYRDEMIDPITRTFVDVLLAEEDR